MYHFIENKMMLAMKTTTCVCVCVCVCILFCLVKSESLESTDVVDGP